MQHGSRCNEDQDATRIKIRVGHAVADDADIHMYALISAYADWIMRMIRIYI